MLAQVWGKSDILAVSVASAAVMITVIGTWTSQVKLSTESGPRAGWRSSGTHTPEWQFSLHSAVPEF